MSSSTVVTPAAIFSMPGSPATTVGIGLAGLPAMLTPRPSTFLSVMASRPQKVKKSSASMSDCLAAFPRMSPG